MVWSASSSVESKDRLATPPSPVFGTVGESCPCGCGGKTFHLARSASLTVCLQTMAGVRELILRAPLPPVQKHLLHVFLHHTRNQRECWPSEQRLLLATGVRSRQTLSTHKKALRDLGLLDWLRPRHPDNPRSCSLYLLSWEVLQELLLAQLQAPPSRSPSRTTPRTSQVALATSAPAEVPVEMPVVAALPVGPSASTATSTSTGSVDVGGFRGRGRERPRGPVGDPMGRAVVATSVVAGETTLTSTPAHQALEVTESAEVVAQEPQMSCPVFEDLTFTLDEALLEPEPPAIEASTVLPVVVPCEPVGEPTPHHEPCGADVPCEPAGEPPALVLLAAESEPAAPVCEPASPTPPALAPSSTFEVPLFLVGNLWREAYLRTYERPYVQTAADRSAAQQIAGACATAVLHHEQRAGVAPEERETQAQAYLRHVFAAYLRRPGRKEYLRERRHPLSLLMGDLNALGEPWPRKAKVVEKPAPLPPPLPKREQQAWCQKVKEALSEGRTTRPRLLKSG